MKKVEDILREEKDFLDNLEVPEELESRLEYALENKVKNKKVKKPKLSIVACLIMSLLIIFNYPSIAGYIDQLFGYNEILNIKGYRSLNDLIEEGKIQPVNQKYKFSNGVAVRIDSIMVDGIKTIVYYTIYDDNGNADEMMDRILLMGGKGTFGVEAYTSCISWEINTEKTQAKAINIINASPKNIKDMFKIDIQLLENNKKDVMEVGTIKIKLNKDKIDDKVINGEIDKYVNIGEYSIHLENMVVSSTSTTLKGKLSRPRYERELIKKDRVKKKNIDVSLRVFVDGKELIYRSQTPLYNEENGWENFEIDFDGIDEVNNIKIDILGIDIYRDINEFIGECSIPDNPMYKVRNKDLTLEQVYSKQGRLYARVDIPNWIKYAEVIKPKKNEVPVYKKRNKKYMVTIDKYNNYLKNFELKDNGVIKKFKSYNGEDIILKSFSIIDSY
ncbi:DUF4179 domain-containing protein [Dethiothermospora halolimnae]|uniref:DUF4179 domain-containing protein n=1 Tax=Dethiothermospora halolimnae TaxID=3114390 RepID=UPI003CCC1E02